MRVLVCGGRDYADRKHLSETLDVILKQSDRAPYDVLIHGGAPGADMLANDWAQGKLVQVRMFTADWHRLGKAAGPIRNQQMLDEGKPDLVVAFPGGKGTADMVARAEKAGVRVVRP